MQLLTSRNLVLHLMSNSQVGHAGFHCMGFQQPDMHLEGVCVLAYRCQMCCQVAYRAAAGWQAAEAAWAVGETWLSGCCYWRDGARARQACAGRPSLLNRLPTGLGCQSLCEQAPGVAPGPLPDWRLLLNGHRH